jgi:hypothetical protein
MVGMVARLLDQMSVTGVAETPASLHLFKIREDAVKLNAERKGKLHSVVQSLLYISKQVRMDIGLPVAFLTTRVQDPDEDDWKKMDRVLRYLNGTREFGIRFGGDDVTEVSTRASIDSSFGVHVDGKSHSALVTQVAKGPVDTGSRKQKIVTKHSTESELVAVSDMSSRVIAVSEFLKYQGHNVNPVVIEQDNQSTIRMIELGKPVSSFNKHINIRYFFIKDRVERGELSIEYVPTERIVADYLTKPLQGSRFRSLRALLLNWPEASK